MSHFADANYLTGCIHNTRAITRFIAMEARSQVISASGFIRKTDFPLTTPHIENILFEVYLGRCSPADVGCTKNIDTGHTHGYTFIITWRYSNGKY